MTTLNLPFKRFVAQVSTAVRSKSSYVAMMEENLTSLQACPWREADDVPVTLPPHDFTRPSFFSDAYDAYKMGGNYSSDMTIAGYAGMAAYRFKIPAAALLAGSEVALSSVALPLSRDRFLRGGVHVGVTLSDDADPSTDWAVIRGSGALAKSGLSQADVPYLLAGDVASESIVVDLSGIVANPKTYLWVYVTLEDYTDYWQMYDKRERRMYAIEGSAMLVGGSASATFASDVSPDASGEAELLAGGDSPTWLQPLPTVNVGQNPPPLPAGDPVVESFFSDMQATSTPLAWTREVVIQTGPSSSSTMAISVSGTSVVSVTWDGQSLTRNQNYPTVWSGSFTSGSVTTIVTVYNCKCVDAGSPETARLQWDVSCTRAGLNSGDHSDNTSVANVYAAYSFDDYYIMLQLSDGVPSLADYCDAPDVASRRHLACTITETATDTWTVTVDVESYAVAKDGPRVQMRDGAALVGSWTSSYSSLTAFFDPSVAVRLGGESANDAVEQYGLAAVVGDLSAAVATFEAGTLPSNAELLGRLARMSRESAGEMAYLHPAAGALANELDVLRPVPRFFRTGDTPPTQTACQPGLSAWYYRPSAGSAAEAALAYRGGVVSVVAVDKPVFLQLAPLALRAPRAFENRVVLSNGSGSSIGNGFALRFVAWRSPAADWDRSTSFALAAMATMPSLYRSDGGDSVTWTVDCSGSLAPFGSRTVSAKRLGASEVIAGDIDDGTDIEIVLSDSVAEGDVVLIAPEVVGFAGGAGGTSVTFGRQANPATAASFGAWARYACDLGWFPTVTGS